MFVCIYIYIYIYTHKHILYTYIYIYIYIYTCTHTYIHTHTHAQTHTHTVQTYGEFGIFKPHADTQTVGICVVRNWWCRGVIESSPNLVLGCNQWGGMRCF